MFTLRSQSGQGILETIVAIGVIITAIVGTISLVAFTLRSTSSTLNRLIAQNLAWEGIEVAVNLRDTNFLQGSSFDTNLSGGADTTAIFTFDENSNVWLVDFSADSFADQSTVLYRQGGLYRQAASAPAGEATSFRRLIIIEQPAPEEIVVTSSVQWTERGDTFEVSSSRALINWRG